MANRIHASEECDATVADQGTEAGLLIKKAGKKVIEEIASSRLRRESRKKNTKTFACTAFAPIFAAPISSFEIRLLAGKEFGRPSKRA